MNWEQLVPIGAGLFRSIAGWLENAAEDGVISSFEWTLLGATIFRVVVLSVSAVYGLGLDIPSAAGLAVGIDFVLSKLHSTFKKK